MSRRFTGTTDKLLCSIGGCALTGDYTFAALLRRNTTTNYHSIMNTRTSAGVPAVSMEIESNAQGNQVEMGDDDAVFSTSASGFASITNWYMLVVSKTAGSNLPRLGWFDVTAGGAWTHENHIVNIANPNSQAGGAVAFGEYKTGAADTFDGWLAVSGIWNVVLTDAQKQELSVNARTSDWYNNTGGTPRGLWEFNGTVAAGLTDLTGNGANQSAVTGTSQDTGVDPPSWNYNGTGAGGGGSVATPPAQVTMNAAVVRGSWW